MMAATVTVCSANSFAAAGSSDSANLADATFGLDIVKIGDDAQTYDQADLLVGNVSVEAGMLSLSDVSSVSGDIYVASGATLVTGGNAISLGEGQTLTAEAGSSVTLAGLSLDGGTLSLDLGAPTGAQEEAPSLSIVAAVAGSGGVITLVGDLSSLETAQLMLAKGDWSQFANGGLSLESLSLLGGGSTPLSYSLMANSEGLYLSLAAVSDADSNIWAGTTDAHEWDADSFSVYGTGALAEKAIFNDSAAHKTVTLSGTVSTGAVEIVGGSYSFEGSGSIAAGSVSAAGGGASTISNIALSGTKDDTILVDGSELTIVQLTPTNPSAPIALTNAAKLTIGDASHRYDAFSGKVTGDAGSQLHLYTTQVSDTYWQQDGTVQLLDGSTVQDVYIHGDLALNIIARKQGELGDKFTNVQSANLHMDAGSQLVVRDEEGTGITPTSGNIVLGGDLSIVAYSPVTTATSITSSFTQEEGATTKLIKKQTLDANGKDSTGSLTLSGNIDVDAIEVQAGTLQLTGSSINVSDVYVKGGSLNMNHTGSVNFSNLSISGGTVNFNAASELTSATVTGGTVNFNAEASIDAITISGGNVKSTAATFGKQGGVITLAGGTFELNRNGANAEQILHSTLQVSNAAATAESPSTSVLKNAQGQDNMIRTLRAVEIDDHNVLELQQFGWNTIWNINALTGEGTLRWTASTNHSISSRLILSGDNSFSGLIELHRSGVDYTWVDNGAYQAYLVLANDGAAKNATISLQGEVSGSNKNNIASLVINTENAAVLGIIGNELSLIYAGDARESVSRNDAAPGTTAANTLTIAGAGDYTFAGTVGTSVDTARLSLAMTGEGKQTFSGQAYVGNVSVSKGELVLSQANVDGSVTVSGGALNMMGSTYTLGSGDVLSVLTGTEHSVQLGNLTLSGGEMVFDASLLNADTSALSVGTVSLGAGTSSQLITFNNIDNLESGRYLLSDRWTAVDGLSFSTGTLAHGTANVLMQDGALYLDYTAAEYYTWTGAADGNWNYSSNNWDNTPDITTDDSVRFIANRVAIFETDANVTVSEAVSADSLIVRNGATLNLTETAALTVNSIEVAEGSTLAFKTPKAGYTVGNISGAGTVELLLTSAKNSITLGENFTGETHVTGGDLVTNNLQVGSTLRLSDSVTMYAQGGDVVSDIVVDGTMDIWHDTNVNTLFKGDISGAGTINHRSNGYFEFYGEVDIARFVHTDNNVWGRDWFKNITKIGEVDLHGGHLYFDNDSTIGTLTVSTSGHNRIDFAANYSHSILSATIAGGTVNFNGTSEVAAMTVSGGTVEFKGDLNLQSLNLTGGTVTLKNAADGTGKNKFITNVKLAGGGVLYASFEGNASEANGQNVINLGTLEVNGTGRFGVERSSSCWQGTINIANLTNAAESASSVLTLTAGNQVDYVSVINLNGGSFVGTIKIEDNSAKGNGTPDRKFAVNINDENVAAGAIIQFVEPSSATDTDKAYNHIALGLGSTTVTMAGLSGETTNAANIYAYQIKSGDGFNNKVNESDTAARTLILNVTSETPLTTNAIINGGISLVKTGAGSQTISGEAAVGSVAVQEGALILSNASSTISGDISVSGGQLDFGGTYTLGDSLTLSVLTGTKNAVQLGGMTLSGGQMLFDASQLSANSAALSLGSAAVYTAGTTQTVTLDFSKLTGALANGTYKLASGDWSGANNDTLTYNGMGSASFNATADGLYLVYTNDGVYTWVGGAADTNWSSANWVIGPDTDAGNNLSFAAGKDAIFNSNATAVVSDAVTAGTVYIMDGAEVTWKMEGEGASLSFAHVDVVNGKLSLGQQTNWTGMAEISVRKDGALVLNWGTGLAADKLLLQGGTIELHNGAGTYHELNTAITVDGSGLIKGSSTGNDTVIKGSIAGTGTLSFEKIHDNPIKIESTMTDGAEGALSVNIGNANIVYAGAKRYTGGTTIGAGGMLTVNAGGSEGGMVGSVDVYGTLKLNDGDATGWGSSANTISAINVYAGGVLNVAVAGQDMNQTGSGIAINLQGGTMTGVSGSNFDLAYGGSSRGHSTITALAATGATADNPTVSSIDTVSITLRQHTNVFEVQENAQLNVLSNILHHTGKALINGEGNLSNTFTKTGLGELVLSGENTYEHATTVAEGTLTLANAGSLSSNVTVNAGAFFKLHADTQDMRFGRSISGDGNLLKTGGNKATLTGANTYTGTTSITGGTLELAGTVSMASNGGAIDVASGATLLLNTSQELTLGNDITGQGTIDKKGNQAVILAGDVNIAKVELANGDQNVGSLTFTGETVKVDKIHAACGNIYIGGVGASTFMQVESLETGDCSGGDGTTVQISAGSTLSVTSDNNEAGYKTAGIILGEWTRATDLTVHGTMLAKDAKVMVGDNAANVVIDGGVMAVKGFAVADTSSGKAEKLQSISIDLKNGGSLILGDAGISTDKTFSATFGEGTVGMSAASTTIAENVTLNSAEGTTFDTTQYAYETNADGVATGIVRGTEGGDLVLSGNVSSAKGVDASMKVVGAGALHVAGSATVSGDVTVEAGATLAVSSGSTAMACISSADDSAAATISGGVKLSHGENSVSIADAGMDVTEISNSLIELQQGVSLNLSHVHLAADSAVMGAGAAQATSGVMLMEGELTRNDVALESVSVAIALDQNATRGADAAVEDVGSKVMMLDSSAFTYNNLTGSLTVEFSGELAAMLLQGGYDAVGLSFTGSEMATDMTILGMYDGITGSTQGIFATDAGSSAVVYFSTDIIPEPATGTLSLLALAALAMRRRRR